MSRMLMLIDGIQYLDKIKLIVRWFNTSSAGPTLQVHEYRNCIITIQCFLLEYNFSETVQDRDTVTMEY